MAERVEQSVDKSTPEPVAAATPAPAPPPTIADQYELDDEVGDESSLPEAGGGSAAASALPEEAAASAPAPPPPSKPAHPAKLIQMALDYGFSDEEIASRPTEALAEAVYHIQKKTLEMARQASTERELARAVERPAAAKVVEPEPPPEEEGLGLDETQYDPGLMNVLKAQQKQIKALREELTFSRRREEARANETMAERVDRAFGKHEKVLGQGRRNDIAKDSAEYARRLAVLGMVDRDGSHRSLEEKIDRAVEVLYGKQGEAPVETNLSRKQREWSEGGVARPTSRAAEPEAPGIKKARRSVADKLREMALPTEAGNGEADDEDFLGS